MLDGGHGSRGWGRNSTTRWRRPPDNKGDDESGEEENEEDDTDEETVSVTSSSQVSAGRVRPPQWNVGKENTKEGTEGPPEDPSDPSRGGGVESGRRGTGTQRSEG